MRVHLNENQMIKLKSAVDNGDRVLYMDGTFGNARVESIYKYTSNYRVQFRRYDGPDLLVMLEPEKFFINGNQAFSQPNNSERG